MLPFNIYCIF